MGLYPAFSSKPKGLASREVGTELGFSVRHSGVQISAPSFHDTPSQAPSFSLGSGPTSPFPLLTVASPFGLGMLDILRASSWALPLFHSLFYPKVLHPFVRAAKLKYHQLGDFNNRNVFLHSPGG